MTKLSKTDSLVLRTIADCLREAKAGATADDFASADALEDIANKIDALIDGAEAIATKWIVWPRYPSTDKK